MKVSSFILFLYLAYLLFCWGVSPMWDSGWFPGRQPGLTEVLPSHQRLPDIGDIFTQVSGWYFVRKKECYGFCWDKKCSFSSAYLPKSQMALPFTQILISAALELKNYIFLHYNDPGFTWRSQNVWMREAKDSIKQFSSYVWSKKY